MEEDEFERAVCEGDVQTVRRSLQAGRDVNQRFTGILHGGISVASISWLMMEMRMVIQHEDVKYERTALHVAIAHRRMKMAELLIQNGADVEAMDEDGETSIHWASRNGDTTMVKLLIEHGANVNAKDKNGRTALHMACNCQHIGLAKVLIQNEANANARDEHWRTAMDYVSNEDYRCYLKTLVKNVSYHKLMKQSGGVKVDRFKLCICGPQEAGKSTLKESLQTWPVVAFFWDHMTPDSQPHEPTPGVNVRTTNIPGVGEVSVWDFAGQSEYAVTHSMFMDAENTVFIVMYNIMDDMKKQKKEVHWWLCFIKSCNRKIKPNVILLASHADQTNTGNPQASSILELMMSEFKDHLNISDEVLLLDCRKTRQTDMWRLKELLTKQQSKLLEHQRVIPKLCAEIMKWLPKWTQEKCRPDCPVLGWEEYKEAARDVDRFVDEDFLRKSSQYLDHLGEVVFVNLPNADPIIVLEPNWLCTDVFGKVMAPENFPIHLRTSEDIVTKLEIQKVFKNVADVDLVITLLQEFQLCHTFDGQEFIIPGLLTQTMPPEKWQPTADPTKTVYFGKQVQCADTTDMFSSGFFPRVQTRLMRQLKNRPLLWKDGAKCFDCNVESLIKLSPDGRAVNICVRSEQADKPSCQHMLEQIESIINNVLDECSPGTTTEERVLSARALKEHREEFYSYSMDQINKAKAEDGVVYHDILGFSEDVNDLLYCGRDDDDDEEEHGAVGGRVQQKIVGGYGNTIINPGDGAVVNVYQGAVGAVGGQLQLEDDVSEDSSEWLPLE